LILISSLLSNKNKGFYGKYNHITETPLLGARKFHLRLQHKSVVTFQTILKNKQMKKLMFVLAAIGFITMSATTKMATSTGKDVLKNEITVEKYKACIDACNACIASCKKVKEMCDAKKNDKTMEACEKLCKDCISKCRTAVKSMTSDSKDAKSECAECAKACEKCAAECDKHDNADCKKCATDCMEM
jgi:hypothetical protein